VPIENFADLRDFVLRLSNTYSTGTPLRCPTLGGVPFDRGTGPNQTLGRRGISSVEPRSGIRLRPRIGWTGRPQVYLVDAPLVRLGRSVLDILRSIPASVTGATPGNNARVSCATGFILSLEHAKTTLRHHMVYVVAITAQGALQAARDDCIVVFRLRRYE